MSDKMFGNLFLSAGAMKAGTTWLYMVLERHPELYFTAEKEIHYFYHRHVNPTLLNDRYRLSAVKTKYLPRFDASNANVGRFRDALHWAAAYLTNPVDDFWYRDLFGSQRHETYACDFSNLYALLPADAWSRIHADCEKLRVLYTLRHPVERLWSHVKFHLQMTNKIEVLQTWQAEDFESFARQPFLWENSEYGQALRNMKAGLPNDAFRVVFFEDMHNDQRGMLASIEDFLEVPHFDFPDDVLNRRFNESASHPMPEFFPELFRNDVARIIGELEAEGLTVPQSWHDTGPRT